MSDAPPERAEDGRDWFAARFNVPRETLLKLDRYAALLSEWQARYNLVGPSTLPFVWTRHFADSAQLVRCLDDVGPQKWLDIGSGAGFPGIVLGLMRPDSVTLVDSVAKKTRFLKMIVEELGLGSQIHVENCRVESLGSKKFDLITARACAPVAKLFDWGHRSAAQSTTWLLLKGAAAEDEIADAQRLYVFDYELIPSLTDPRGRIVKASNVRGRRRT